MLSNEPLTPSMPPPEADFRRRNAEALRKIAIFADLSEGFTVGIVEVALERDRAWAIQALLAGHEPPDVQWIVLNLTDPHLRYLMAAITEALQGVEKLPGQKIVLLLSGLEQAIGGYGDYPPILSNLNIARDTYAHALPYPMVFLLPSYAVTRLARFAPDFWAWKSIEVRLHSELPPPASAVAVLSRVGEIQRILPVPQERFDLLYRLLQDYKQPSPTRADLLNQLGQAYESHIKYAEAAQAYQEALKLYETLTQPLGEAETLNNLAELYYAQGRYSEAEPLYARSLDIREQQLGVDHPDVAQSLNNVAVLYQTQGRYSEAEPLLVRALYIRERQLGADHSDVAQSLNNLAGLYQDQGRYNEAELLYARSLNICERQLGVDHPHVANSLSGLATLYQEQGRYNDAEPLYARSLDICERQLGMHHPYVAASLGGLAILYQDQGRYSDAEPLYARSIAILERQLGADHPHVAIILSGLATLYQAQGRYSEAEPLFLRSLDIQEQQLGANHTDIANSRNNLANLYDAMANSFKVQNRHDKVIEYLEKAISLRSQWLR
jgi:tetratricopeptide (TPR) repeat protein